MRWGRKVHDKFVLFGPDHVVALFLTVAIPIALAVIARATPSLDRAFRWFFAAVLIGTWIAWFALFIARGWLGWGNALPMNLCDWADDRADRHADQAEPESL